MVRVLTFLSFIIRGIFFKRKKNIYRVFISYYIEKNEGNSTVINMRVGQTRNIVVLTKFRWYKSSKLVLP